MSDQEFYPERIGEPIIIVYGVMAILGFCMGFVIGYLVSMWT